MQTSPTASGNTPPPYGYLDLLKDVGIMTAKIACVASLSFAALATGYVLGGLALPLIHSEFAVRGLILMGAAGGLALGGLIQPFCNTQSIFRITEHNFRDIGKYLERGIEICATTVALGAIVLPIIAPLVCLAGSCGLGIYKIYHIF